MKVNSDSAIQYGFPVIVKVVVADPNLDKYSAVSDLTEVFPDSDLLNFLTSVVIQQNINYLNYLFN